MLVVILHFSTMSHSVDRPVCVTGGAFCPGWTPLTVSVPRAEHVVSMWIPLSSSESETRVASNSCLSLKRSCGWFHALHSGGSASNIRRIVSLSLRISAWPVVTEDFNHHGLISPHWFASKARLHLTFNSFLPTSAGLRHGSSRCTSWCCIRPCLICSRGGVVSPAPRVVDAVPPATPLASVTFSSVTEKVLSDATLVSVSAKFCFACSWTTVGPRSSDASVCTHCLTSKR